MKYRLIITFMTLLGLLYACGSTESSDPSSPEELADPGYRVFKKHCVVCHGIKGNLQFNGAKDLGESELILEGRMMVISFGRNTMPGFSEILTPEEIEAVSRYTMNFKKPANAEE